SKTFLWHLSILFNCTYCSAAAAGKLRQPGLLVILMKTLGRRKPFPPTRPAGISAGFSVKGILPFSRH
ncbi:MAG: hypothetical protein WBJ11_08480, partial [Dethiobacteria bacterium]